MSQTNILEERLMRLQATLDETLSSATRRKSTSLVILVIGLIALSFYLMVAYYKIAEFDSKVVILNLENYTRQQVDLARPQLAEQLIAYAPDAADQLESLVRQAPGQLTSQVRYSIKQLVVDAIPDLEAKLYLQLKDGLDQAHEKLPKDDSGQVDEKAFRAAMDDVAASYGKEVQKLVDQIHAIYTLRAKDILDSLTLLAKGKNLDASQQQLRGAMIRFLQLMEKWEPKATPQIPAQ
ncbi:MAG: hypothetical protein JKX85_04835 [Phycisphaeraceae bacterium]|nr:hypothetical protein [Phycisphaeraceae bacterium]